MVGGGIFATTGLAVELTRGAVPVAFIASGIVALLTSYSYLKLTLRYPTEGGTVEFLNRGFGTGIVTGAANILLCFSYVVLLAIYAYALGSYAASFFPTSQQDWWRHLFLSVTLIGLAVLNAVGGSYVIRSENALNLIKMVVLAAFVVVGLCLPIHWERLAPDQYVGPIAILSGAMIAFFNYEGFELIANAAPEVKDPQRSLPVAYVGGVLLVMVLYVLIGIVAVGHMSFDEVAAVGDHALAAIAHQFMGPIGKILMVFAAVLACGSAINATLYSSGRLTYIVARTGELPRELEREIFGLHLEGMIVFAVLSLILANFVPLGAIATMGSAGFLLIFMAVNIANVRLAKETQSQAWISILGALSCAGAVVVLCLKVDENAATRNQLWILVGMIAVSFAIEIVYRAVSGRSIRIRSRHSKTTEANPTS